MDHRFWRHQSYARQFRSKAGGGFNGAAHELALQFGAAVYRKWIEIGGVAACPGKERDLIDGCHEGIVRNFGAQPTAKRRRKITECFHPACVKNIEPIRPSEMKEVPDNLDAMFSARL